MAFSVIASQSSNFAKRVQQGRDRFEKPRPVSKKLIQEQMSKIVRDEVQFSKSLLKQMIPLDISIDKNATGLKKIIPVNFALAKDDATANVATSASASASAVSVDEPYVNEASDAILVDEP